MDDAVTVTKNRWSGIAGRSRWSRFAPLRTGLVGGFNTELYRHVPIPYHQCQSTVPRITAHLQNLGIDFSELMRGDLEEYVLNDQAFLDPRALRNGSGPAHKASRNRTRRLRSVEQVTVSTISVIGVRTATCGVSCAQDSTESGQIVRCRSLPRLTETSLQDG